LGRSPKNVLTGCFTFAKPGELFGHLLDGHIIHLLSKHPLHNIGKDPVERDPLEFLPGSGIRLDTLQGLDICR
jgi:hypothetical protein